MTEYSVYVIELDINVRQEEKSWRRKNPDQSLPECFYVGQSAHSPECRFLQHVATYGMEVICNCSCNFGNAVNPFQIGRALYAKDYSVRLRSDLYEHLIPFESQAESKKYEAKLAQQLKEQGYGVYYA